MPVQCASLILKFPALIPSVGYYILVRSWQGNKISNRTYLILERLILDFPIFFFSLIFELFFYLLSELHFRSSP